ncbi:MAG: pentapeptide repeat-containing protein [Chloroflexi bacterium]|nr:pentapeptide repeat-containing protein [Chloroflexota bacterium]
MREILYRMYAASLNANVWLHHRLFQLYLRHRRAELAGTDLSYLNLQGTNLRGANLRQTNLHRADLTNVNLHDADLSGADLTGARVSERQLAQAKSLAGATLPDGTIYLGHL